MLWGVSYLTGREAIFPAEHQAVLGEMRDALEADAARFAWLCDMTSVHWVVTAAALGGPHWRLAAEDSGARLYENLGARPIAYAVPARYLGERGVATRPEDPPPILPVALVAPGWDRWRIRTDLSEPAAVVLAQSRYPGWRVTVDGRPAELRGAERLFMSVAVPAGAHTVEFSFDNACVKAGAWLSRLGWLLWALSLLAWARRPRAPSATAAPPALGRPST
ncbi:MAG: YfhO family protein [Armatimonadetes bacterium]|nr:YfhO family protein [Armatimonadota bacterium]